VHEARGSGAAAAGARELLVAAAVALAGSAAQLDPGRLRGTTLGEIQLAPLSALKGLLVEPRRVGGPRGSLAEQKEATRARTPWPQSAGASR